MKTQLRIEKTTDCFPHLSPFEREQKMFEDLRISQNRIKNPHSLDSSPKLKEAMKIKG